MRVAKKQLTLLSLATLVLLILVWQVSKLMHDDIGYEPTTSSAAIATTQPDISNSIKTPPETIIPAAIPTKVENTATALSAEEKNYLDLLDKYKFAKLRHRLLDEELAIATTRDKISKLSPANATFSNSNNQFGVAQTARAKITIRPKLVYLDIQNGVWSATLNLGDHFEQITAGVELSDGSRVISIAQNGVIIQANPNERYKLSFNGITPLPSELASAEPIQLPKQSPATMSASLSPVVSLPAKVQEHPHSAVPQNHPTPIKAPNPTATKIPETLSPAKIPAKQTPNKMPTPVNPPAAAHSTPSKMQAQVNPPVNSHSTQQSVQALASLSETERTFHLYVPSKKPKTNFVHQEFVAANMPAAPQKNLNNKLSKAPHQRTLDETVLLEMPSSSFTIKLREANNREQLAEFAKQHNIEDRTLCYSHAASQNLFTLVYGDYLTPNAAKIALQSLPVSLRNGLTIELLQKVQQEIVTAKPSKQG